MAIKHKKVIYNGGTESRTPCTIPSMLTKNRVYEVIGQEVSPLQVDYILKGFPGTYNSSWFDDFSSFRPRFRDIDH